MRILFLTQYFPPETGAAPARAFHFARAMARARFEVRVVTGLPNHPSGVPHPGYTDRRRAPERVDGIDVERVWLHTTPRRTAGTRFWNHLTFAWSALPALFRGPAPDVVLASTPPLFLAVSAQLAAWLRRAGLVIDCRDDWPHAAVALGELRSGPVTRLLQGLATFLQRHAAGVIAVTPGMMRELHRRGLDAARLVLITNGADTDLFTPGPRETGGPRRFTVLYAGTHGLVHGMEVLLDAAERLRGRSDVWFVLVGDGVVKPSLQRRAAESGLSHVEFRPSLAPEQLVEAIREADVCVATTGDHEFCGETIPVKLFDYLACGRPVAAAVRGDAADVVTRSGGGVVVEPGDGPALAEAIASLIEDPVRRARLGSAGQEFVRRHYSRRATGDRLVAWLLETWRRTRGRVVTPSPQGFYGGVRRLVDVVVAGVLLIVFSPFLAIVAVAIRLDSPGPALFRQCRIGRGSAVFTILKFRTMHVGTRDMASHLMGPDSCRVTRVGRMLRRWSIDELPQLWNVWVGDMTLIGPRPALFNQDDLIALRQAAGVDALKPGVTGLAQINGRDGIGLEAKVEFDRHYLECLSPALDLWILFRTAVILFSNRGVF